MTFEEILDHAIAMLQCRGRLTYSTLKRQFQLDDAALEDCRVPPVAIQRRRRARIRSGGPRRIRANLRNLRRCPCAVGPRTRLRAKHSVATDGWRKAGDLHRDRWRRGAAVRGRHCRMDRRFAIRISLHARDSLSVHVVCSSAGSRWTSVRFHVSRSMCDAATSHQHAISRHRGRRSRHHPG